MGFVGKKKVAIFICGSMVDYQSQIVTSLSERMTELGYYSIIYNWFGGFGETFEFEAGEMNAAYLPDYSDYDGIFLCLDTFTSEGSSEEVLNLVKKNSRCPVVCLRRQADNYHSVLIDDENSMTSVVRHLIEHHHFNDLFYVSGIEGHPDAVKRLECFKRVLTEYGMEFKEENLFHGDFWRNSGDRIVNAILERRKDTKLPEAIVCANDYMAIAVIHSLQKRGYEIPKDVVVTGFDDIEEASYTIPTVTSVRMDIKEMAYTAVDMFIRLRDKQKVDKFEYVTTRVVPRQSCGCGENSTKILTDSLRNYYDAWSRQRGENLQSCFMSLDTVVAPDIESLNLIVGKYINNNDDFKDFFVVLNDYTWGSVENEEMVGYTDEVVLRTVFQDRKRLKNIKVKFPKKELLPEEYIRETPMAYYVIPLHFHKASFGYAVINYSGNGTIGSFYEFMLISICNSLQHMRTAIRTEALIDKLSSMYVTDVLTGLKNRHGFDIESHKMYNIVQNDNRTMAIIGIDMDGLKIINDTFGHVEGDYALRVIADAIREASFTDEIGFRVGGDEFQVLAMDYSENSIGKFLKRFTDYLDNFNKNSLKRYNVRASYGYVICAINPGVTLTEWLAKSDDNMYDMKEKNRATRKILK